MILNRNLICIFLLLFHINLAYWFDYLFLSYFSYRLDQLLFFYVSTFNCVIIGFIIVIYGSLFSYNSFFIHFSIIF